MVDLSIEEANKIRLSMGLPALPGTAPAAAASGALFNASKEADVSDDEPASTIDTRQAAAYDNWKKLQDEAEAKKKREARAAAIKKDRDKAARYAELEGKGLAEEEDIDDVAWLKSAKKRQKKIAKVEQMQREFEERERQEREALQYTEADLAGIKVGHEVDQFDGEDQVLVLKDTAVDGDDDDELEAVDLREKERLQERLDSKKRKRAYDPNEIDESRPRTILSQYDEEIEGKKGKAFTLDGQGRTIEDVRVQNSNVTQQRKMVINLGVLQDVTPSNDYMDISEMKIKQPKKKRSKKDKRKRTEDEEDTLIIQAEEADVRDMEIDGEDSEISKRKKKAFEESLIIDDDDLQANLTAQRQRALKKRMKLRPEDIARQLRESSYSLTDVLKSNQDTDADALVIDETTEFVQNLESNVIDNDDDTKKKKERKATRISDEMSQGGSPASDDDGDIDMNLSYAEVAEADDTQGGSESHVASAAITGTGLEAEKTVDQGIGATLALLRQRGLVNQSMKEDKNTFYRDRQKFLADKMSVEADAERQRKLARERERGSARWNTMTPREREEWARKQNSNADMNESRRLAEIFNKEYKPNVELTYVDEHGRQMNQKEAFKQLSHQFHGKGSGNTKTKKHLDKVATEKKKMAESSLEASRSGGGGFGNALDQQAKKHKTAGVRLQ